MNVLTLVQRSMEPELFVHNVVATIQIESEFIDIAYLHKLLPYTTYDKSRFAAITIRLADPVCTCLLFTSGKLVVTGASCWDEGLLTAYCIRDILQSVFPLQTFTIVSYVVQNIVAHVELGLQLDLPCMYEDRNTESTFQRNLFPGLIFRPENHNVVLLCFKSGKIVVTGGKSIQHLHRQWRLLWPVVMRYVIR